MFESNKSLEAIRAQEVAKVNKAQASLDKVSLLLDVLPKGTPVPSALNPFGYCAEYSLQFEGPGLAEQLLQLYPTIPLVNVQGSTQTQKPVEFLRAEEANQPQFSIYPVVFKSEKPDHKDDVVTAQWWTRTPAGLVQVLVRGVSAEEAQPDKQRFDADSQSYSTGRARFFNRKVAISKVQRSPMQAWCDVWIDFGKDLSLDMHLRSFVREVRRVVESTGKSVTSEDFSASQPGHLFERLGEGWTQFNEGQRTALLALSVTQADCLPLAKAGEAEAYTKVEAVLASLFQNRCGFDNTNSYGMTELIRAHVCKMTGLDVTLRSVRSQYGQFEAWATFQLDEKGNTYKFAAVPTGSRLLPQDIELDYL